MPWLIYDEYIKTKETVKKILDENEINCLCGSKLLSKNLRHSESKSYETATSEYWIYVECKSCHYDYNYEKIVRQFWNKSTVKRLHEEFQEELK